MLAKPMKIFYKTLSILSIILGIVLFINSQTSLIGATIGLKEISSYVSVLWGAFFILSGFALFYTISLEK